MRASSEKFMENTYSKDICVAFKMTGTKINLS